MLRLHTLTVHKYTLRVHQIYVVGTQKNRVMEGSFKRVF